MVSKRGHYGSFLLLNPITIVFFISLRKSACAWITPLSSPRLHALRAMSLSMSSNPFKRVKLDDKVSDKVIGTHSGTFQADEALGVWMLRQLPAYRNSKVVRSRDKEVLDKLDIVIDVGGVYDHDSLRYDHHQRGYDERFDEGKEGTDGRCTKLSASGLVYRHYGRDVIKQYYPTLSNESLELAYTKLYDSMLEALDAIDTGVEMAPEGVELLYKDSTGLSSRVSRTNPRWNEVDESTDEPPDADERFEVASKMCGDDFLSVMTRIVESDIPARDFVERALLKRHETDASGEVISLESGGLPWRGHLYDLEKEHNVDPLIKFVLYTDQAGMWRIQAVTVEGRGFENRLSLPEEWRGVRDEDLAKLAGIPGCTFCHAAGFVGGNKTYEGALEMARVALTKK
jgi:uncharacterized UPF0160 family protein